MGFGININWSLMVLKSTLSGISYWQYQADILCYVAYWIPNVIYAVYEGICRYLKSCYQIKGLKSFKGWSIHQAYFTSVAHTNEQKWSILFAHKHLIARSCIVLGNFFSFHKEMIEKYTSTATDQRKGINTSNRLPHRKH